MPLPPRPYKVLSARRTSELCVPPHMTAFTAKITMAAKMALHLPQKFEKETYVGNETVAASKNEVPDRKASSACPLRSSVIIWKDMNERRIPGCLAFLLLAAEPQKPKWHPELRPKSQQIILQMVVRTAKLA